MYQFQLYKVELLEPEIKVVARGGGGAGGGE